MTMMSTGTPESEPVKTSIAPWLSVSRATEAVDYYKAAFGAVERYRLEDDEGSVVVARLAIGEADFWLQEDIDSSPRSQDRRSVRMILTVDDPDSVFEQAIAAGATEVAAVSEGHGWRIGRVADPFGHHWEIGKQIQEEMNMRKDPAMNQNDDQETQTAINTGVDARLARHGGLSYLHMPAVDVHQSAAFYEQVFGWNIRGRDTDHPSFDDGTGHVSGAWVTNQAISREPGLLPYIYVDRVDDILEQVEAQGGEVVKAPYPEGNLWVATFRDPAGNVIGLWQEGSR